MPRPQRSAKGLSQRIDVDAGGKPFGIHLPGCGVEKDVGAPLFQKLGILLEGARIAAIEALNKDIIVLARQLEEARIEAEKLDKEKKDASDETKSISALQKIAQFLGTAQPPSTDKTDEASHSE